MGDRVAVFDILGYPPRTHALGILSRLGTPMTVDSLSEHVVDSLSENPTGPSASRVRKTSIALHHTHLPLLDDAGVITYDPSERVVASLNDERLDDLLEEGRLVLDALQKERRRGP